VKKLIIFLLLPIILALLYLSYLSLYKEKTNLSRKNKIIESKNELNVKQKNKLDMKITSPVFSNYAKIPEKYTCDGENINPPLKFIDVPKESKSLVLIVDDPDAPTKTWVHWVVYNIDPNTAEVKENSLPKNGVLGMTDFGQPGWGGPCPPSGSHRYFFKLYALDAILDVPEGITKQQLLERMKEHVIEQAQLVGIYSRR